LDTTDSWTFLDGNSDVAHFSPRFGPGVSNDVVFLAILRSIADSSNGVIKRGTTLSGIEDTVRVHLEDSFVGLNGDRHWGFGNGSLKLDSRVGWNVDEVSNFNSALCGIICASACLSSLSGEVWISGPVL